MNYLEGFNRIIITLMFLSIPYWILGGVFINIYLDNSKDEYIEKHQRNISNVLEYHKNYNQYHQI